MASYITGCVYPMHKYEILTQIEALATYMACVLPIYLINLITDGSVVIMQL